MGWLAWVSGLPGPVWKGYILTNLLWVAALLLSVAALLAPALLTPALLTPARAVVVTLCGHGLLL